MLELILVFICVSVFNDNFNFYNVFKLCNVVVVLLLFLVNLVVIGICLLINIFIFFEML